MALGLDRQVADELVAVLDAVFEEEAVADGVVGDVVLDAQVVGAVHGHAAVVGVVDRGVLDVLALRLPHQVPVDRVARQRQVLAHAVQFDACDVHLARAAIAMMWPPKKDCSASSDAWTLMLRVRQADFAALVDVEGDLAEVHVVKRLVERERVAADGGDGAPLGLARIEVGGGEDDLVTHPPARGIEHLDRGGAGLGRAGQLAPGIGAVAVQVERAAQQHDAAVAHAP